MGDGYELLRSVLADRPIAFHPTLARVLGGVNEALLFQQIAYWSDKGDDPEWIYKTQAELEAETTLTRTQQENARKRLRSLGVIQERKAGLPAKLYYRVDWPTVFALLDAAKLRTRMQVSRSQGCEEDAVQPEGSPQAFNGAETTTETTARDVDVSKFRKTDLVDKYDGTRMTLLSYAQDLAREMNDQAPLSSTTTRLVNLYKRSGLDMDSFINVLMAARGVTKERTGSIRGQTPRFGPKPKMAYMLAVVEDMIGDRLSPNGTPPPDTEPDR